MAEVVREVIREPATVERRSNNGVLVALLMVALLIVLAVLFGGLGRFIPRSAGTSIQVPKQIDVNVNQGGGTGGTGGTTGQ